MRRYGVARYLTAEQRERAAAAEYKWVALLNACTRGDCDETSETVQGIRSGGLCPLGVALRLPVSPDAFEAEDLLSSGVSPHRNMRRLAAIQNFIHDVDAGKIAPDQVRAALGAVGGQP